MEWYYVEDGERRGPFDEKAFDALVQSGHVSPTSLVWNEEMSDWRPLGEAVPSAALPPPAGHVRCGECQQIFPEEDVVTLAGKTVCSACKAVTLQRLREGVHSTGELARDGKNLVAAKGAQLPDRCVKCNAPATRSFRKKMVWHPPWIFFLILVNLIVLAVVAYFVQKKAEFEIKLCEEHWVARRRSRVITTVLVFLGIAVFIGGCSSFEMAKAAGIAAIVVGLLILFGSLLYGIIVGGTVSAVKITDDHAFIKGACPEYLAEFPEWQG